MKFCFLDINNFKYSFKDLNNKKLRGGEAVFINLSKEVSNNGHQVHVYNNCEAEYSNKNYFNYYKHESYKSHILIVSVVIIFACLVIKIHTHKPSTS